MKTWFPRTIRALPLLLVVLYGSALAGEQYMVPNRILGELPGGLEIIHDYGERSLIRIPTEVSKLIELQHASRVEASQLMSYRTWQGFANKSPALLEGLTDAWFILALAGPMDPAWPEQIKSHGLQIIDHVHPHGLLVRGDAVNVKAAAKRILTSSGLPLIGHALPLPDASRLSPEIAHLMSGRSTAADYGIRQHQDKLLIQLVLHRGSEFADFESRIRQYVQPGPEYTEANYYSRQYAATTTEIAALLDAVPEVAFIEPVYPRELHNNIAVQPHLTNIQPVWDNYGYSGSGLIAGVNDSGLDLNHADFPASAVVATSGDMANTDSGHGTHVSGTVLGRGTTPAPSNTHACGDVTPPLGDARGMAYDARIIHNNIFSGGIGDEAAMMAWHYNQGAVINNNSWGYGSFIGPSTDYGVQTVAVDAAVRNADPTGSINAQMAIVFSAGNSAAQGVGKPGNGKNVITVGASQNDRCGAYVPSNCAGPDIDGMACFSSQGPSQSRIKPDIVAPGTDILSSESSDSQATQPWDQSWTGPELAISPGTSMSAPVVTGAAVLFFEHYQTTYGQLPSPALVKAALINTATDMGLGYPSNVQGWGRLNLLKAIEGPVEDGILLFDQHEVDHLQTGQSWTTEAVVGSANEPLRISLVWTDPAGASGCSVCHINDLDLVVTAPDGTIYRGNQFSNSWSEPDATGRDSLNNVENVYIELPASGHYSVEVIAHNVAQNPNLLSGQDFALVVTGDLGDLKVDPGSAEACMADGSIDFTLTLSGQFEATTQLSATAIPAGTSGSFSVNPVVFPADSSVFTLSDLEMAAAGEHVLEFSAVDTADSSVFADAGASLVLYSAVPQGYLLLSPPDQATDTVLRPGFAWSAVGEATSYRIQIAADDDFGSIVFDELVAENGFVPDSDLATGTRYYWRVSGSNVCGDGAWSEVFEFQTRFEPVADVSPLAFEFEVPQNGLASQELSLANTGTGNLVWSIEADQLDSQGRLIPRDRHEPVLDEALDVPDFSVTGAAGGGPVVTFEIPGGVSSSGTVVGFTFEGTVSGITTTSDWASDMRMVIASPEGASFDVGGFTNPANDWDFQGGGSANDGTYTSTHIPAFGAEGTPDAGDWTLEFRHGWNSNSAGTMNWSDVTITLHKEPLPVCIEDLSAVPWLSVSPDSGSVGSGDSETAAVTVNANGLGEGFYRAWLCLTTNAENQELIPIPVELTVTDQEIGQLQVDPVALSYGEVDIGDLLSQSVTASNVAPPGAPAVELADILPSENDSWSVDGSCQPGMQLSPGDECSIEVSFSPVAVGLVTSGLEVTTVDGQSRVVVLDGIGVQKPAELHIDPEVLEFGPVTIGDDAIQSVTISNVAAAGAADLELSGFHVQAGEPEFSIADSDCAAVIAPETSCTIEVRFAPEQAQLRSGVLRINVDGHNEDINLSGQGAEPEPIIFHDRFEE